MNDFDMKALCDHMEAVKSGSIRESWSRMRSEFYRLQSEAELLGNRITGIANRLDSVMETLNNSSADDIIKEMRELSETKTMPYPVCPGMWWENRNVTQL